MARIGKTEIVVLDPTAEFPRKLYVFDTHATTDGIFSLRITETDILEFAYEWLANEDNLAKARINKHEIMVHYGYNGTNKKQNSLSSTSLEKLRRAANLILHDFNEPNTTEEVIILYKEMSNVNYVYTLDNNKIYSHHVIGMDECDKNPDGTGLLKQRKIENAYSSYRSHDGFSFSILARIFKKITYERNGITKIELKSLHMEELKSLTKETETNYATKLNMFEMRTGIKINDYQKDGFVEIPYSEEAAKFFYDLIISICRLSHQFDMFLGTKDKFIKNLEQMSAIGSQSSNLLEFNSSEEGKN